MATRAYAEFTSKEKEAQFLGISLSTYSQLEKIEKYEEKMETSKLSLIKFFESNKGFMEFIKGKQADEMFDIRYEWDSYKKQMQPEAETLSNWNCFGLGKFHQIGEHTYAGRVDGKEAVLELIIHNIREYTKEIQEMSMGQYEYNVGLGNHLACAASKLQEWSKLLMEIDSINAISWS